MRDGDLLVLDGADVLALLDEQEQRLLDLVRMAYVAHARGSSALPHSTFLRFPGEERNRIIALPAYLGDGFSVAGMKWVSSFPGNLARGMDRASAVVVLNSAETGRPVAFMEGSTISAKRTAASAALAAVTLHDPNASHTLGVVGCGLINFEVVRFTLAAQPALKRLVVYDLQPGRAEGFAEKCRTLAPDLEVSTAGSVEEVLRAGTLTSFATTATVPHVESLEACPAGSTVLHISLRDLTPEAILAGDNVVDDVDHVCRAQTSVHLAEQLTGTRSFIRCALADILLGVAPPKPSPDVPTIFSPFGLGVLDIAVAQFIYEAACAEGRGSSISSFFPTPWVERGDKRPGARR
ncbi:MAG: 2,3-diaminopropionate biosynthesis protein SbnB [Acidobacteria bacterium]|nr:2,3-diaminopropionate biosynthesis protein SbnB [Acidobacteriota bacterium]